MAGRRTFQILTSSQQSGILVFKGLMTSSITQSDESRLINYKLEMTWKGAIVLNLGYYPAICLVTLMKTKINDSQGRNWKPKLRNRPKHHLSTGRHSTCNFYQTFTLIAGVLIKFETKNSKTRKTFLNFFNFQELWISMLLIQNEKYLLFTKLFLTFWWVKCLFDQHSSWRHWGLPQNYSYQKENKCLGKKQVSKPDFCQHSKNTLVNKQYHYLRRTALKWFRKIQSMGPFLTVSLQYVLLTSTALCLQ